jgi:hypothetical protein
MADKAEISRTELRRILDERFDEGELRTLAFDLQVDYDSLRGERKADKARELVAYMERHELLSELASKIQELRPMTFKTGGVNIGSSIEEAYSNISTGGDVVVGGGDFVGRDKITATTIIMGPQQIDHAAAPLKGLGLWIWRTEHCEGGDAERIASRAATTGLSHIVLKIADGAQPYPSDSLRDLTPKVVAALQERSIQVWGWHYLKGSNPAAEAQIAVQRIKDLNLNGYVADVESEFKKVSPEAVQEFFKTLRDGISSLPIALSSFRYPSYQRDLPWLALLEGVDFVMPQVYWEQAHNPGAQFMRSIDEYARQTPAKPYFPVGSAYSMNEWRPTASDLAEFIQTARDLGLNGASFFNWDWLGRPENRELWAVLEKMRWETTEVHKPAEPAAPVAPEKQAAPEPQPESPIPAPTFERRFIQIIRNDEVDKVEDRLGFDGYADTFVKLVLDERTRPPLTIGISGAWGSGKSFLLHRIEQKLEDMRKSSEPSRAKRTLQQRIREKLEDMRKPKSTRAKQTQQQPVYVVHFNAWDYNASEAVWPGLVRGILDKLEEGASPWGRSLSRMRRNFSREFGSTRGKFLPWAILLVATLVAVAFLTKGNLILLATSVGVLGISGSYSIFKLVFDLPMAQWITDLFSKGHSYGSAIGYMDEIRKDIKELKKRLSAGTKIVVVIDDLDRCSAEKIADTLEAIKLLLVFDMFIVFLAVDSNVIARAIEKRYKEMLAEAGRSGYLFLDKIIQIPFRIPEPDPAVLDRYLYGLLMAADQTPTRTLPKDKVQRLYELLQPLVPGDAGIQSMLAALPEDPLEVDSIALDLQKRASLFAKHESATVHSAGLVWATLARWWPVSTYVMHEAMRAKPAELTNVPESESVLVHLANLVEKQSAAAMPTQRLRELADGPLNMFTGAIKVAPRFALKDLEEMLVKWTSPYSITLGFSQAEIEAFRNLSRYLFRNPRHIKRLVNTYSLIRMLAAQSPGGESVTNAPEATLKWLIISSQWPLMTQAMLQAFEDELEIKGPGEELPADDDALARLFEKASTQVNADRELQKARTRLDGDPAVLAKLIGDSVRILTSKQLALLRAYSINFNPAESSVPQTIGMSVVASGNLESKG